MPDKERVILGASLLLNVVLFLVVVWLWPRARDDSGLTSPPTLPAVAVATTAPTARPSPEPSPIPVTETPTPTLLPTETAVFTPTSEPTPTPLPTETLPPTETPAPTPTSAPAEADAAFTGPLWLRYLNQFRLQAGLPFVTENTVWSSGSAAHSRYMMLNNSASHAENAQQEGYSEEGARAAANGNIAMSGSADVSLIWPFDYWISASFHALPMLDPQLQQVGYGEYRDARSAAGMTATLDVKRGRLGLPDDFQYPITFPKDGGEMWVTTFNLPEFPNSAAGCPGYTHRLKGAPLIVQIGPGDQTPAVTRTELRLNGAPVPHCSFNETNYQNENLYWQDVGRKILDERDAIIILPRDPLEIGKTYQATVEVNGMVITWQFSVVPRPPLN